MATKHSLEKFLRIYNDETGEFVEVREDRDSLGLIEIVQEKIVITITPEQAPLVMDALQELTAFLRAREKKE